MVCGANTNDLAPYIYTRDSFIARTNIPRCDAINGPCPRTESTMRFITKLAIASIVLTAHASLAPGQSEPKVPPLQVRSSVGAQLTSVDWQNRLLLAIERRLGQQLENDDLLTFISSR